MSRGASDRWWISVRSKPNPSPRIYCSSGQKALPGPAGSGAPVPYLVDFHIVKWKLCKDYVKIMYILSYTAERSKWCDGANDATAARDVAHACDAYAHLGWSVGCAFKEKFDRCSDHALLMERADGSHGHTDRRCTHGDVPRSAHCHSRLRLWRRYARDFLERCHTSCAGEMEGG
jgi:hypothetical protein